MPEIIAAILLASLIFSISINKVYTYLIGISIFLNIGGYFKNDILGFPGYFTYFDFALFFVFLTFFFIKKIRYDIRFKSLLFTLIIFVLYQFLIAQVYNLSKTNIFDIFQIFAAHKWRILAIFICIPTYYYIQLYAKEMFFFMLFVSAIILILYFITISTTLPLIPVIKMSRDFVNAERIWFENPGYIYLFPPMMAIALLLNMRVRHKLLFYFTSVAAVIFVLLTLTRGSMISMVGSIFLAAYLTYRIFSLNLLDITKNFLIYTGIILFFTGIFFSGSISNIYDTMNLSFKEASGSVAKGTTQSRSEFEMPKMLLLIKQNPLLGTGMKKEYFQFYGEKEEIGVADLAVLGHIAMYGIIGILIYLARYLKIHKTISFYLKRKSLNYQILNNYEILLLIWAISTFYSRIFLTFINFSGELYEPGSYLFFGIMIGIIYGLFNKIRTSFK